ncbi:hypothetical protein V5799_030039 [Amblyomma americanum]|uniref:Putative exosome complex component RRP41 n=1 Tax=Amblyomma americanum TaxID=6943 RepID=A0AAQ4EPY5_AMBAM
MATFSTLERKRRPRGDKKSQEMTLHIQQAFEASILTQLYPRSQIDIFVETLQSDGGTLSVCINAATLALIDAGIALKDYVCACSVGFVDDVPLVDISHLEESMRGPELTVAVLPKSQEMVLLEMTSRVHVDNLQKMLDAGVKGCTDVHAIFDSRVKEHTAQEALVPSTCTASDSSDTCPSGFIFFFSWLRCGCRRESGNMRTWRNGAAFDSTVKFSVSLLVPAVLFDTRRTV